MANRALPAPPIPVFPPPPPKPKARELACLTPQLCRNRSGPPYATRQLTVSPLTEVCLKCQILLKKGKEEHALEDMPLPSVV